LSEVFSVTEKLTSANAQEIYGHIDAKLKLPEFKPRALFEKFNIEVLATTDAATDTLEHHKAIRDFGWNGRIIPTFRPDGVINIDTPNWRQNIDKLSEVSGIDIHNYKTFIQALENRREYFKLMDATATDHAALSAAAEPQLVERLFHLALIGETSPEDAPIFTAHMLYEMARMSVEDGLVMQFHVGSFRNHNDGVFEQFGSDKGSDIPIAAEFTRTLKSILDEFSNHPKLKIIVFTLDESTYTRELAPLAGHYPALKLGPPWWFHDSLNGMRRYFDQVMETAGLYNTVGFNDDTRAFPSIPARHDLWRRTAANWIAGLVVRGIIDMEDAQAMSRACAYDLAKAAYNL